jgi:hypothetical protein
VVDLGQNGGDGTVFTVSTLSSSDDTTPPPSKGNGKSRRPKGTAMVLVKDIPKKKTRSKGAKVIAQDFLP